MTRTVEQPLVEDLDSGVIKEARRSQRIRRVGVAGATLAAASVLVGAFLLASGGGTNTGARARSRPPEPLPRLTGRALTGPTGLLIVAHGNEGPPFILNVDRHTVDRVRGLGVPLRRAAVQSPLVGSLSPAPGAVMAAVEHARTAGVWIATAHQWAIVDPLTGRTRAHADITRPADPADQVGDQLFTLHGDLAVESLGRHLVGVNGGPPRTLRLVNLISGHRRQLVWPSYFGDIIRVVPEPHGPLVAVDFGSPAYPGPAQAEDVWILDTTTGTFTHLPGYPARVDIKFSDIAWTTDERLVIIAQGGGRTVLGLWKPGQATLRLRTVPARDGYHFVALAEPARPGAK